MNASVHPLDDHAGQNEAGRDAGDDSNQRTWNDKTQEAVAEHAETVREIKKQRTALNDRMKASKSQLVAIGMNAEALQAAQDYANASEDERRNFDETYIFARRSLGCPIQQDLFVAAMGAEVTVEVPPEKKGKAKDED